MEDLPADVLQFLTASRYCETDELSPLAWPLFGGVSPGWARVEAVVDWTHRRFAYDYR